MPQNIVETAREAGTFHTLLTAAEATGVGGALANGRMTSAQIRHDSEPKTVEGALRAIAVNGGVSADDAPVIQVDVEAENGVIHVIDRVLMPAA